MTILVISAHEETANVDIFSKFNPNPVEEKLLTKVNRIRKKSKFG